jgi:tRNA pseudouridine55 synthase
LSLWVACSKGTYIRSLAEDLGRALAAGRISTALRRVAVGALPLPMP